MMKRTQQGFTLIELMIVVAIIGILAAIAVPAYNDYMGRAKISEAIVRLDEAKTAVADYFAYNQTFGTAGDVGLNTAASGEFVASAACTGNGSADATGTGGSNCDGITVTLSSSSKLPSDAQGKTIVLYASSTANGTIRWVCTAGNLPKKYLPGSCK